MFRDCCLLAFLGASLLPVAAEAQPVEPSSPGSGLYLGGSIAAAFFSEIEGADYELGVAFSGLAGIEWVPNWRAELELSYEEAEFENSADETSLGRLSAGLYTDFDRFALRNWVPYAGGGVGIVNIDVGNDEDNTELSAHGEFGFSSPISAAFDFVPGVRVDYIVLDGIDDQIITQLRAGLRWHL